MRIPYTYKMLVSWAGEQVVRDAEAMVERGVVLNVTFEDPVISGSIRWNNRDLKTSLKLLSGDMVENRCPCYANTERGVVCSHVIALALYLLKRQTDPRREAKQAEEQRRAARIAEIDEGDYIQRVPADTPGAVPASLQLTLPQGWEDHAKSREIPLNCRATIGDEPVPIDQVSRSQPLSFSKPDESLLYVLEDIAEGPPTETLTVNPQDFSNILELCEGREIPIEDGSSVKVDTQPMSTHIRMDLDRDTGELVLYALTELPEDADEKNPFYMVTDRQAWVCGKRHIWPIANTLPLPYHDVYARPIVVARKDVVRFLREELPALQKFVGISSDLTLDLFSIDPATPTFRLVIRGSAASISASLEAHYGDISLIAGKKDPREHFCIPDEEDLLRYTVRNGEAEKEALELISHFGMRGACGDELESIIGRRDVLNFLGCGFPALRRRGWKIDLEGRVAPLMDEMDFATPVVHIDHQGDMGWFEVGLDVEAPDGHSLSQSEVQKALLKGENFVEYGGKTLLLDVDAITAMREVFEDCSSGESMRPGRFTLSNLHAPFVQSSLDALDGVDVDVKEQWQQQASRGNRTMRLEPVKLPQKLEDILRPYQRTGISWLRFLEVNNFSGILADEMGLGKTLQTLAWIDLPRHDERSAGKPVLIVCPTSIVENWAAEAARFTPGRKVLVLSGADRHEKWDELPNADIGVTSYALLRRDLKTILDIEFSAVVLDEAQHIKNHSTQNAKSAKQLRTDHRLVLTGTPVENSVSDLWSIMDFLMPGYLGSHEAFRERYERPVMRRGPDAAVAQAKLRRKMQPFLLRRLKKEVARDLPPKIEKIEYCTLSGDQRSVYTELVKKSRDRLSALVAEQGFHRSRFEVLTTLMRLRQACCHLGLLKMAGLDSEYPSSKMELFFELLDQAMDGGHRVLVFSQFVEMLQILKSELESKKIDHCYLDGTTKERLKVVHEFNAKRNIPVFLISLKAGGTGLNLTGADMVIHFDPWWNPAVENQATDRAYRIGQKRTVYSVKLIAKDSVEEKVLALQERKQAMIDSIVESDDAMIEQLTWEEVQDLLTL